LAGRDVLGLSKTGSGKTAAFVLPILDRLLARKANGPRALIIAPTRELAAQIELQVRTLAAFSSITSATIFGGVSEKRQIAACRARPDIVVACPGRLLDLWSRGAVDLRRIEMLVIDEADHMFDLGFLPDVRRILAALPAKRQNLLFSATMPRPIRALADRLLQNPLVIELTDSKPAAAIDHFVCQVAEQHKVETLRGILRRSDFKSAIVFSRTKRRAKQLADRLARHGHRAIALQGNMSQPQRERAMQGFSTGRFEVLVATDIAARGIDVTGVTYVVNFDVPWPPELYTHRIGRTGRAERSGQAFTFATPSDAQEIRAIEQMLGAPIPRASLTPAHGPRGESTAPERRESRHAVRHPGHHGNHRRHTHAKGNGWRDSNRHPNGAQRPRGGKHTVAKRSPVREHRRAAPKRAHAVPAHHATQHHRSFGSGIA
jgi:ATP-dependent RNA helicase RhlE